MENKILNSSSQNLDLTRTLDSDLIESENLKITTALHITNLDLPSQDDFMRSNELPIFQQDFNKWSSPKYRCPKCINGAVRQEMNVIYTSNPPMYRYECDKCGYSTFHYY